jgi:DNA polymerase III delta subunit
MGNHNWISFINLIFLNFQKATGGNRLEINSVCQKLALQVSDESQKRISLIYSSTLFFVGGRWVGQ